MFRSSGPRTRRPARAVAPDDHHAVRRESALLGTVQLILATIDPSFGDQRAHVRDRLAGRRAEIIRYLQLQGGELHGRDGLVTRHLAAALGRSRDLHRILRQMEADGTIVRDVRGRRTYCVRLVGDAAGAQPTSDERAAAPSHLDFEAFAEALLAIITKRLAVIDPDNRVRYEQLDRYRARLVEDLGAYRAMLARRGTTADEAAERAFFEEKLAVMVARAHEYEAQHGFPFTDALTDSEQHRLDPLVRAVDGARVVAEGDHERVRRRGAGALVGTARPMVANALASLAVRDLDVSRRWYERLLGPGRQPMPEVLEWSFPGGGGLQVYLAPDRAGRGSCTLVVDDIEGAAAHLRATELAPDVEPVRSDRVDVVMIQDPDGNSIAFSVPKDPTLAR